MGILFYQLFWLSSVSIGTSFFDVLTLLHSERPKLYTILAFLSAIELKARHSIPQNFCQKLTIVGVFNHHQYTKSTHAKGTTVNRK